MERIDPDQIDPISNPCSSSESTGTSPTPMESTLQATPKSPIASSQEELEERYRSFVAHVRWEFRLQPKAFKEYLAITQKLFSAYDKYELTQRLSRLFIGHPRLMVGFNEFLPPLYRIQVVYDEKMNPVSPVVGLTERSSTLLQMIQHRIISARELRDARSYIDKVRSELRNQPAVFNDFLSVTRELYPESEKTPEILHRVSNLLRGHPELIAGYNDFLPLQYKIKVENDDEMQVDGGSSLSGATGTSLTHSQQTQQATANPPTASSRANAEPPAENRSSLKDAELLEKKRTKGYARLRL